MARIAALALGVGLLGSADAASPFVCNSLPGNETLAVKPWDGECKSRAAVMEIFTWHDEVVPTSVQLLASAGADCIAVLKPNIGVREYDVYDELHRWAPGVKLIHGLDRIEEELKKDIKLVIVDTVEDLGEKSEIKMDHALRALADAPSRPQVVLGCHNLAKHLMSLERVRRMWPDRRITSLVFTPAQKRSYVAAAAAYEAANGEEVPFDPVPIQSVPFYFGQDTIYGTLNKGFDASETSLLGIGALSQKRRDYTVLEQLQVNPNPNPNPNPHTLPQR
mmetsp:Transcript_40631/g.127103  ORF Transcript_40631/g.127103 Transcript_40631/m.127103 type:complete len:278 (-) Transcript_40631:645-1478(-)